MFDKNSIINSIKNKINSKITSSQIPSATPTFGTMESASVMNIGASGTPDTITVTGSNAITSFGASVTGTKRTLIFQNILTISANSTSLILPVPSSVLTVAANSSADFVCIDGANGYWKCTNYIDSNSIYRPVFQQYINTVASNQSIFLQEGVNRITGTATISYIAMPTVGSVAFVEFTSALKLSHHTSRIILPTGAGITTAAGDTATFVCYAAGGTNTVRCVSYQRANGEALISTSEITTDQVLTAISGAQYGSVGTYAFLGQPTASSTNIVAGTVYAGSNFRYAGGAGSLMTTAGATPSGSWMAVGSSIYAGSALRATMFLRVA